MNGDWPDVLARIGSYLQQHHEPHPALPESGNLLVVDRKQRRIIKARSINLSSPIDHEPEETEYWRSTTVELWFGGHSDDVSIRVRMEPSKQTSVELLFSSRVHEILFGFDPDWTAIDPQAKSDFMRLCIGLAKELKATGFSCRRTDEDNLFGPPSLDVLRDYVEAGYRWLQQKQKLIVAGLAASAVLEDQFEYDFEQPPMHYRQNGYYLCDRLWPVPSFSNR
ncbi:hypothetical protein FJV41_00955 [Myxococcus llanfairpwllgwyngyllgogerychwyrndrobwllllantysiliogogogochensis]|uniref:Uncharacterized protein n=1 Tax=Myxococcus llanfairpwllgwyngyllgogerychwyrndrobwllllantysiliogogogochensis TaxID=2590453 RepID=A0A540X9G5_9BACT|nr:hypothetical protein FJV41_00955 [Myxococcus llanfairpwllgwyngyllgogerychwyrndrobwllllantysiliogogogochensis]